MNESEREFMKRAEQAADTFRARYGVGDAWTDEQIDQALAEAGYPQLSEMPAEPRGMMVKLAAYAGPLTPVEQRQWRRGNAMHLLGHVLLQHPERRCDGCRDW